MPPESAQTETPQAAPAKTFGRHVAAPAGPTQVAQSAPTRNCLLVDDSRMIRKVSRKIVEKLRYTIDEAENGQEALNKCKLAMPDLIILDWDMPIMTGIEFLAELRALKAAKRPKVVFCTTHSGALDIHKAIEIGADEYVTKPFDETQLVGKLEAIGAA